MQETITVNESLQGKFGPQLKVGNRYYSFGKFYKGDTSFDPGTSLEVDVYVTESGNKYINKVNGLLSKEVQEEVGQPKHKKDKEVKPKTEVKEGRDFDLEAYGKCKFGLIQSLFPMMVTNPHDEAEVKRLARKWALEVMVDDREEEME